MSANEFAAFESLDLAPIKMKLMHVESGEGWSALRTNAVETEYRRFLFLMKKYPDAQASPTVDVDIFWHYHILDTMKYARDCEVIFGYFLHHYPYVGIGAGANEGDHLAGGERMRKIYEAEFGTAPAAHASLRPSSNKYPDTGAWQQLAGMPREAANAAHAYCGAPGTRNDAVNDAQAYCGAPGTPFKAANAAHAYCGAPATPREAANDAHAYCGAPGTPGEAANAAYAYCGAPAMPRDPAKATYAYCGAPAMPHDAARSMYAYCGAPGMPRDSANAAYAYCGAPGMPRDAANAAYAYCGAPGKQSKALPDGAAQGKELAHAA